MFPGFIFYAGLIIIAAIDVAWLLSTNIDLDPDSAIFVMTPIILLGAAAIGARRLGDWITQRLPLESRSAGKAYIDRLALVLEGLFFIRVTWLSLSIYNHVTMSLTSIPYADEALSGADASLGLDWRGYFLFATAHSWTLTLLDMAYVLLTPVSVIIFLGLMIGNHSRRAGFYIAGYFLTAVICITLGTLFPADGAVWHLASDQAERLGGTLPGAYHVPILQTLRGPGPVSLDLNDIPGLVTFPSFHTAAGIALSWSLWRTRLFWPVTVYAALMIASTPVSGGHYFIDLIGGGAIALAVLAFLSRRPAYKPLFSKGPTVPAPETIA